MAWFAQLCLPLVHAAVMAAPTSAGNWCGDPARAQAFIAELPAELREAVDPDGTNAHRLDGCAKLCAVATTTPPLPALAPSMALRDAGLEPVLIVQVAAVIREPARKPPAHGPPALA